MAKKEILIGDYKISESSQPYMIAEIGINHNGDIKIAKKLIDAAFITGWNSVKFQKRTPDLAVPEHQKNVIKQTPWGEMTYLEYKHYIEFGKEEYDEINHYCKEKPIDWSASPWDIPSLNFLLEYNVPYIKIASATNTNTELLIEACKSGKPIILSTGMSTLDEVDNAVDILEKYGAGNYSLLHTNSNYSTELSDLNLKIIETLKNRYKCIVGYSGHEYDLIPSEIAVVYGAKIIERHVTLSHEMWGTDQKISLEISGMDILNKRIKTIDTIIGSGEKRINDSEWENRRKLKG